MTTGGSAITDELRAMVGTVTEPVIHEVERGAIRRYVEAVDDPNPLFSDVGYARGTKYGELICPPGFFGWPATRDGVAEMLAALRSALARAGCPRLLDGGMEYEFYLPIRAGDILISYARLADITEREGKMGKMLFTTVDTTYINQNGDVVAKARQTRIHR